MWICAGCGASVQATKNAKRHQQSCPRYKEISNGQSTQHDTQVNSNKKIDSKIKTHLLEIDQIEKLIVSLACPKCGKQELQMMKSSVIGHRCVVEYQCQKCLDKQKWCSGSTSMNQQFVQASLLGGIDYAEYRRQVVLANMNPLSESQFNNYSSALWNTCTETFQTLQSSCVAKHVQLLHRAKFGGIRQLLPDHISVELESFVSPTVEIGIKVDFRWSQRRNALNGTLTVRTFGNVLLGRVNVMRTVSNSDSERRNFVGAAKNMEGAGISSFLDEIVEHNNNNIIKIIIAAFVHDQDGCTTTLIKRKFPEAKEFYDVGHAAKNLKKRVTKAVKGLGEKSCAAFLKCIKGFPRIDERVVALRAYPHHLTGDHRFCFGGCSSAKFGTVSELLSSLNEEEKNELECVNINEDGDTNQLSDDQPDATQLPTNGTPFDECGHSSVEPEKLRLLKKIFDDYAKLAAHFRNDINTQVIEAGNNSMCCLTNKRKFYRESYAGRIDASLVKLELGESGLALMMMDAGNPISEHSTMLLQKMNTEKEDDKKRKRLSFIKERRRNDKKRKSNFAKLSRVIHPDYHYKGDASCSVVAPNKKQRLCSNCRQPGHTIAKCPVALSDEARKRRSKVLKGRKRKKAPVVTVPTPSQL